MCGEFGFHILDMQMSGPWLRGFLANRLWMGAITGYGSISQGKWPVRAAKLWTLMRLGWG
jgi:hypothetical protein